MPYQVICCLSFGPVSLDRDFLDLLLTKITLFLFEKKKRKLLVVRLLHKYMRRNQNEMCLEILDHLGNVINWSKSA